MKTTWAVVFVVLSLVSACGRGEDRPGQVVAERPGATGSGSGTGTASASGTGTGSAPSRGEDAYRPVSDVDGQAAIGEDAATIRQLLAPATEGESVDWRAVGQIWRNGDASRTADGGRRALAKLVDLPALTQFVDDAVAGEGDSTGASDAVRRQRVDKGITALLAVKVEEELEEAAAKLDAGDVAHATGAPHDVDEAWAFFTAKGEGPAATADKRAADFDREGGGREPIVDALVKAQDAARAGDRGAFAAASAAVEEGLDYVFYLATFKYLGHGGDDVARAEGQAFYLAIAAEVEAASARVHAAIERAFAPDGDAAAGRAALNDPKVLEVLGVTDEEKVDRLANP